MSSLTSIEVDDQSDETAAKPFLVESGAVMQRLRTAISEMLKTMPTRVRTTRDLQKAFGVDVKLCWQILKLAGPGDALSLAPFVPTPGPMRRFINAATTAAVSPRVVDQISSAYEAFKEQISIHAGDRSTFETMATGAAGMHEGSSEDLQKAAVRLRKSAFQTASHYAGVQLDTYLGVSIIAPGSVPDLLDAAFLRVKLGVRRLRSTAHLSVDQTKLASSDIRIDSEPDHYDRQFFDPEAARKYGAAIIPRFSSNPLPKFKTVTDADGRSFTRIDGDSVGQKSAVDLAFGHSVFNAAFTELYGGKKLGFATSLDMTTPAVVVILDKLIHRPSFPQLDLDFSVTWMHNPSISEHVAALPFAERITKLDAGVDGARTHEVPNYIEMIEFVCHQRQWKIEDFDVYRVRVEYPLHFTRLWTRFAAKDGPAANR
jgi:hypothetical protein